MTEALARLIKDQVEQYGDEDAVSFTHYSGRGMYGKQCVGIVGDEQTCMEIVRAVIKEAHAAALSDESDIDFDMVVDTILEYSRDNMGRSDIIIYWPNIDPLAEEM